MATKAPRQNTIRRRIYDYITANPGKTGAEVGNALGISQQDASGPLSQLYGAGKLERQKVPGTYGKYAYFIPDRERSTQPEIRYITREPVGDAHYNTMKHEYRALEAVRDRLEVEVVELRQWKADAIVKHPDLAPVDPLLLKARELAAEALRENGADLSATNALAGELDNATLVKAVLKALSGGLENA